MTETFLGEFIREKSSEAIEPSREGVARGESIGFSRKKYLTTLHTLYNNSVKDIADITGVSYGVLRRWRTEEAYKKLVEEHVLSFASFALKKSIDHKMASSPNHLKECAVQDLEIPKIMKRRQIDREYFDQKFSDVNEYSSRLFIAVSEELMKKLRKAGLGKKHLLCLYLLEIQKLLIWIRSRVFDDLELAIIKSEAVKQNRKMAFPIVRDALMDPVEEKRKLGLFFLDILFMEGK